MKILIVCPSKDATANGNVSTASRIASYFDRMAPFECLLSDFQTIAGTDTKCHHEQLDAFVAANGIHGVLFLHAYKTARILLCERGQQGDGTCCEGFRLPYGIIFGGTDLNVDIHDKEKLAVITKVAKSARFAVAFNESLKNVALRVSPKLKVFIYPQAVRLDLFSRFDHKEDERKNNDMYVFLMVTGLRPVKDPIFLLDRFHAWSTRNKTFRIKLLILGPIIDEKYANAFFEHLTRLSSDCNNKEENLCRGNLLELYERISHSELPILYSPPLCSEDLQTLMKHSSIIASVNSSQSEGMASSVLEAMAIGLPVIARNNLGNSSLVHQDKTGLLFDTPDEFVTQAERLINDRSLRSKIADNALEVVREKHSVEKEKAFYQNICKKFFMPEFCSHADRSCRQESNAG